MEESVLSRLADALSAKGCGRGYDVVMLALHGYDAFGLEISATAVETAKEYASAELKHPQAYNFGPGQSKSGPSLNRGNVNFVQGDFFSSDWESEILPNGQKFELIYDYTAS
jgi:hypothetical protein